PSDVGGLAAIKAWFYKRRRGFSQKARKAGLPPPKGILLLGVPGSGKSLTARALTAIWSLPLLRLDTGRLFSGQVGASEERVRQALASAEAMSPCVLWIDELDKAMAGLGSSADSDAGTAARVFATLATWSRCKGKLPPLSRAAHKGSFGHLLVVAGDRGFGGAGLLAAEAAARSGAGLVSLATRPEHIAPALARCPSLMVRGVDHGNELAPLLEKADAVVCGPGLGQAAWGQQMLRQVLDSGKPRLLDADALNLLAAGAAVCSDQQVLTPHPGEAARLLGCSVAEVEADRLSAVRQLQQTYGGITLLKGAGTLVAAPGQLPVLIGGANPGMATGGMGDILSGIVGGFMAQAVRSGAMDLAGGTINAAALHLAAASVASRQRGYRSLLPMDVIDTLPTVLAGAEPRLVENDR
ncbi:MAG: NAD(P)H-hydrate dehydratase, partial [Marinobacter sp.]